jgi:quercetin dioxygenase-like cupin family protein
MSVEGIILHHGEAGGVTLHQTRVDYLLTAEHSKQCSIFEFSIAPGFNTGAHYHTKIEEIFYVLEGDVDLRCGDALYMAVPAPSFLSLLERRTHSVIPARRLPACC